MSGTLSSEIAIAEDAREHPADAKGLKRRQSDALEQKQQQENKRQRTSPGKNSPTAGTGDERGSQLETATDNTSKPAHREGAREVTRKSGVTDEKQRSKRLFGALLGNLNQPGDRVSKRRSEIEQRRKAELQKQDDERLEDRQRRLENLAIQRKKEQVKVDEQNMHARHKSFLNTANFLQTKAEPKLYYLPWDLLPDEEDRIDNQIKEVQAQIDKEVAEWEETKRIRLDDLEGSQALRNVDEATTTELADEGATKEDTNDKPTSPEEEEKKSEKTDTQTTNDDEIASRPAEVPESDHSIVTVDASSEATAAESGINGMDNETTDVAPTKQPEGDAKDEAEDEGDHVVEGDEDTVIY